MVEIAEDPHLHLEMTVDGKHVNPLDYFDQTPSEQTVISVTNDGLPISRESQDEIFVPFFTTKQEGTGIGLSLSRQIMRLHNGTLSLTRSDASSTVFTLIFK